MTIGALSMGSKIGIGTASAHTGGDALSKAVHRTIRLAPPPLRQA